MNFLNFGSLLSLSYNDQYYDENNIQKEFESYVYLLSGIASIIPLGIQIVWLTRDSTKHRVLMSKAMLFYFGLGLFTNTGIILGGILYANLFVVDLITFVL